MEEGSPNSRTIATSESAELTAGGSAEEKSMVIPVGAAVQPQYSVDDLPVMDNRLYAKWDDNIYYRQYNT